MRTVVIDTNCLVQMISKRSPYRPAWDAFLQGHYQLCISNAIISEYLEIITAVSRADVAEHIINAILESPYTLRIDPKFHFNLIQQDKDDNKFVDCAIIAGADYIVSEDAHFHVLKAISFPHVHVISLDSFIKDIEKNLSHHKS